MSAPRGLDELAELAGVLATWSDNDDVPHTTSAETRRALLNAQGIDASSDAAIDDCLSERKAQAAARVLPAELLVRAGRPLDLALPRTLTWKIDLESGEAVEGRGASIDAVPPAGLHRLVIGDSETILIAGPERAPAVEAVTGKDRLWGITAALYGLRSSGDLGIGDYAGLARAAEGLSAHGASFLGINPVHALGSATRIFSPYSPSSRTALETRHLSVTSIPEFARSPEAERYLAEHQEAIARLRAQPLADYDGHRALFDPLLRLLFQAFESRDDSADRRAAFARWRGGEGRALASFALFEALSEVHGEDWRHWPKALQNPEEGAVSAFAGSNESAIAFHHWLQFEASRQLEGAQRRAVDAGMALGLYLDIAVGVRPGGADTWALPAAYARGVSLGAPPDMFAPGGQSWGLAPFSPDGLRKAGYRPFVEMLRSAMRRSKLVRIDHVLGFARSFWVPEDGTPGGYVRYPFGTLLAITALEAGRHGALVVGEDLGSVPPGFRKRLADAGLLGCAVTQFERDYDLPSKPFVPPERYRETALASLGTHDTPTVRGWWQGADIAARAAAGQATADQMRQQRSERRTDKAALAKMLAQASGDPDGLDIGGDAPVDCLHECLAGSSSVLVAAQLDDALGVVEQQNLPGTTDGHPNWCRRYPLDVEALAAEPRLAALGRIMNDGRQSARKRTKTR